jgi:phosphomannomutase/phosphoglucomutase
MGRLFGTNGVRGSFGEDLTLEVVHDLTMAISRHLGEGRVLVGRDGRHSSPAISDMVCATLNYAGRDCADAGLVPTPCLEYCVRAKRYAGGIMVTASHNPPQYNGIKPVAADGVEVSRDDEVAIERHYANKEVPAPPKFGTTMAEETAVQTYLDGILSHVDVDAIRQKNYTVALDMGNGAQAVTAPLLCSMLDCRMVPVNDAVDGDFPGRGSEPTPDNLADLSAAVRESGADIGIAFDGDGDRSLLCDENGDVLTGDRSALLLARHILERNRGAGVVTCLNSGLAIDGLAARYGSAVIRTRVGSVEVSRKMVGCGAVVGFEENGGFMYGPHNQVRDGLMTLALALGALESSGRAVSELARTLPDSHTGKTKVR